jgi:hypothetical protein
MNFTDADRAVIEVREMLTKYRNKDAVTKTLHNRGMDAQEARDFVYSIHKANLSVNRKSSLATVVISGGIFAILVAIWVSTGRLFVVWLPISGIAMLWGLVKFFTASGYEVESD